MEQINAPYNFVPLSDKVVIPEWGDKVSHDLPFRDGVSGELELTIEALAPIMVGGEQKQGTERESGQVHFFQTPDKRYAIPGSSVRGVIRSVTEIATFSRMNRIDDKRYGLRDISGRYVADSYAGRVRNNVSYGFLHLNAQGKPSITPCSMVRLSHRELEKWWNIRAPVFAARTSVKQKYELWQQLCKTNAIADAYDLSFSHDSLEVSEIGLGQLKGFPVFTGQINAENPTDNRFGTKYKGRPKNKDFVFHSERSNETFILDEIDKAAWRDFLFIHGEEDGKPDMSWPGFWKKRFWDKQRVPVFYIKGKDRLQIGLAYMPKLAGDFSIHDMLQHTDKAHIDETKPDFAALLFGRVGDKPEDALKGRVYFEPAFLQGQANVNQRPNETILNGAKPSYFPNYIYQTVDRSGEKLASGQYATYVYSSSNPAPELRGWKRYPVRADNEVATQPLGDKQTTKVQTCLHTLAKGSTFKGRLVFHNLKPQELGALLWALQFEGKRHNLGMAKSFGYGQISIKLDWDTSKLVCNDPKRAPQTQADDYISEFKQYMSGQLGKDWRTSTPIEALTAMADPACRHQFAGDLKHMVMGMGKNNDFVTAKQNAFVLESYVKDERKLKRSSHVSITLFAAPSDSKYEVEIEETNEVWENAKIQYDPSKSTLTATTAQGKATLNGADAKSLVNTLSGGEQKKAKNNQLLKSVSVEGRGNALKIKAFF
ncbi:TIGR03986 family CRISPR-associated RAMP protein [Thiothrix litoralis]|jgi:CRISPR-associated protein (TIGR03986 family)|uniref:TIGR03986 family CRISPR-associated RAMP protein n=1 Tax=Thiothrix litoralis TaxID=2891210 RepID=A0ABX7WMT4_9GAMM|nr:TIGR03986 family CRISPR-associated RAMP protein [Thiothrix litoralis]QTR44839.1 TIGR03986 family CRISPR-associated RAMP protein [Thiothrix litoralis]